MVGAATVGVVEPGAIAGQSGREIGTVAHIGTIINDITRASTRISAWRGGRCGVVVDGDGGIGGGDSKVAETTATTTGAERDGLWIPVWQVEDCIKFEPATSSDISFEDVGETGVSVAGNTI